ncbi:IclR family transcriptional regulator [Haladaptatus caseinilyticus]|uniref:IclR family transcriptional regulator n=1 Tax=Haladaptatus caseinilyticus TaxID=2993314 RepID=UPI00224A57CE|nr:IclR family transcriptional regulator [Haladaptatus caseinilyticus]
MVNHNGKSTSSVSTTETSFTIIDTIRAHDGIRLRQLTDELELSKSTIHAHLTTLRDARYVVKEGEFYHLGLKFFEMGEYVISRKKIYGIAEDEINALNDRTDRIADFSVEEHGRVVSLYSELYDTQSSLLSDRRTFYMHNTASGKAILAEFTRSHVKKIIEQWGLPRETEHSISTLDELLTELEETRERGYAVNDEEVVTGLYSVARPVHYPDGRVCGAISLDSPKYRINKSTLDNIVSHLDQTVQSVERNL